MKKYGPFREYGPEPGMPAWELAQQISAQFLCTPEGYDWYLLQADFADDSLKVVYGENDRVVAQAGYDVSALWPVDAIVAEIQEEELPDGFILPLRGADWQCDGLRLAPRIYTTDEIIKANARKKAEKMQFAESIIAPLERAEKYGVATEEELIRLVVWEKYTVQLSRVDTSTVQDIDWPLMPE